MSSWIRLCAVRDLPPAGEAREIPFSPGPLCVANHHGHISVLQNECPHQGGPLGMGIVEGEHLICPWHAWAFNLNTGVSVHSPQAKVEVYEVRIDGEDVLIRR